MVAIGASIMSTDKGEPVTLVKSNRVIMTSYTHPAYKRHNCSLLKNAVLPDREVEDFEIYHIERRFFNGENAIKMCETILGIENKHHTVYQAGFKARPLSQAQLGKRPNENPESLKLLETAQQRQQIDQANNRFQHVQSQLYQANQAAQHSGQSTYANKYYKQNLDDM